MLIEIFLSIFIGVMGLLGQSDVKATPCIEFR